MEFRKKIPGIASIYLTEEERMQEGGERTLDIAYTIPSGGINEETGILVLVHGFGAGIDSKVYKKMREQFSGQYNLVVLQTAYFGSEFMTAIHETGDIGEIAKNTPADKPVEISRHFPESPGNCNDMGPMQAFDILSSVYYLLRNVIGEVLNYNKIILYGNSHGSYLSYLANRYCPGLFSCIIDNSSWLVPNYLKDARFFSGRWEGAEGSRNFWLSYHYLMEEDLNMKFPESVYYLPDVYAGYKNSALILSYHGSEDSMCSLEDKRKFLNTLEGGVLIEVLPENCDGKIFGSAGHGLDADFLKMFDFTMDMLKDAFPFSGELRFEEKVTIPLGEKETLEISYDNLEVRVKRVRKGMEISL